MQAGDALGRLRTARIDGWVCRGAGRIDHARRAARCRHDPGNSSPPGSRPEPAALPPSDLQCPTTRHWSVRRAASLAACTKGRDHGRRGGLEPAFGIS